MNIEEVFIKNPLLRFSIYTELQVRTVIKLGHSLKKNFDEIMIEYGTVELANGDPYGDIWLWIIGAYEIIRTMSDPKWKKSWDSEKLKEIIEFKKFIAEIRVPFAKLEHRNGKPINGECSICGIDFDKRSYLFEIKGTLYNIREVITKFEDLIESINAEHIEKDLRENK